MQEKDLVEIIEKVMMELNSDVKSKVSVDDIKNVINKKEVASLNDYNLNDLTQEGTGETFYIPSAENKKEYLKLKSKTPARLGIHRAGTRYKTKTMLRFRADHAAAMDAVFKPISQEILDELNLFTVVSKCENRDEYLTRPDLGRIINDEGISLIKEKCKKNPQVQIYASSGLSSTSLEANLKDTLPAIIQGLEVEGISVGTPFYMEHGRVAAMDQVSELVNADVTLVLIGERPGLATAESMSCYMIYKGFVGVEEAKRTVISNIHKNGTPATEAGAHIASLAKKMLKEKASGLDLIM